MEIEGAALYAACAAAGSQAQEEAFSTLWNELYPIAWAMLAREPDGEALAADCAQQALIRIHRHLASCREPAAFRSWTGQILRRVVIDELRRPERARRTALYDEIPADDRLPPSDPADMRAVLLDAIARGPLSDRSRRVVLGRYFDERPDEILAQAESERAGHSVLPSHIQVTRAKNLASLRADQALVQRLRELL